MRLGDFKPATLEQYIMWLQGYMGRGGVPTHYYDYPFLQFGRVVCVRGRFGLEAERPPRHIIVEKGGKLDPRKSLIGHHTLLYVDGYRSEDRHFSPALNVPIFNDDDFLSIKGIDPHIRRLVNEAESGRKNYHLG